MVLPLVAAGPLVSSAAGSTAAQQTAAGQYAAPKTGGLTQLEGAQVGGGLGGGVGGAIGNILLLAGLAGRGGKRYLKDALNLYRDLQSPDFDMSELLGPQFRMTGEITPSVYEAQLPGDPQIIADSPLARAQMAEAVAGLGDIARTGLPEADRLAAEEGARAVRGALRGGEESAIRSLRRRGRLGAGQELLAREVGGREAADLASRLGSDLQRQALERRLGALGQYGTAAQMLRGQDIGVEQSRADAINRFKEFAALQRQQAAQYGAGAGERAQAYNVGTQQALANAQTQADYQTALANLQRQNQLRQQEFQNQLARTQGMAGVYGGLYRDAEAQQAAKADQIRGISTGLGSAVGGGVGAGLF